MDINPKTATEEEKEFYPDIEKIKELSDLYRRDTKEIFMSPENVKKKWISDWYKDLYEYMMQSKLKQENKDSQL